MASITGLFAELASASGQRAARLSTAAPAPGSKREAARQSLEHVRHHSAVDLLGLRLDAELVVHVARPFRSAHPDHVGGRVPVPASTRPARPGDGRWSQPGVTCVQNAVIGREGPWAELPRAEPQGVVVVGGGPAGLECARGPLRPPGRAVRERPGAGRANPDRPAARPGRTSTGLPLRRHQCRKLGVEIRLGVTADAAPVLAESPDVVVMATGAGVLRPDLPGLDEYGSAPWDVLAGDRGAGRRVLVIDEEYGYQGRRPPSTCSTAARRSTSSPASGPSAASWARRRAPPVFQRLFTKGATLHCHLRVTRLEAARAVAVNVWSDREEVLGPYDAFVYAYGGESVCGLDKELEGKGPRVELDRRLLRPARTPARDPRRTQAGPRVVTLPPPNGSGGGEGAAPSGRSPSLAPPWGRSSTRSSTC